MARLLSALFLLLAAPPALATPPAAAPVRPDSLRADRDTVYTLPGLTVEERRLALEHDLARRPGFAALYLVGEMPSPTATVSEILSQAVGVNVRQFGGLGAYSAVSVRGSNANQVAFYLDGVPLNQAQYGVVNASDLPLGALERVEVYRGTAPLAFVDPGGGVVNLVTRAARGTRVEARAGYGSFGTQRAEAWGSLVAGRARVFSTYRYQASQGDFGFLDDNGTPLNGGDDEFTARRNNAFTAQGLTAKLDLPLGAFAPAADRGSLGRLTAAADLFAKDSGMPGISSYQSAHATFATRRGVGSLTWTSPVWLDRALELETQAYGLGARDRFRDLANELGSGRQDTDDRTASWGARQRAAFSAGPLGQTLELLAEARREEFRPGVRSPQPGTGPVSRRDAVTLGAEERLEPWAGRVSVSAGLRREGAFDAFPAGPSYEGSLPQPALSRTTRFTAGGIGVRARLTDDLVLRANAGHAERVPSLFELFGNRGTVVGNRDLVPERADQRDVGLAWSRSWSAGVGARASLAAEIALYRTDARDLIVFLQNSQHTSVAQNVSAARLQGVETSVTAAFGPLRATANWTHQDARDRSGVPYWDGKQLPGRPADEAFTREEFTRAGWRVFHEFQYLAGNYLDRANRQPVAARRLHNLGAGASLARGTLRLTAELRNLTDDRVQDVAAYPLPGRSYALTAEIGF